ncbi:thiol reductant ABC exporter subunit CydD [Paenibacillus sp. ACRSA]|uniref:thiol reductant ABC exporter subunit CydD n=1 Tax=Paenibacillus sp. ACRSA TaxID=2918211 RepID=UPI001EF52E6B|nr:thiol reductant ABC exporter subunit CydD [Paenibacillus sp. ACRSA]MCG7378353.1 thiol reductant ABC exporter subunit CydD [Paenibacillus sp. ACRSA]
MGRGLMKLPGIRPVLALASALVLLQAMTIIMQAKWLAQAITAMFEGSSITEQYSVLLLFLAAFAARYAISYWLQLVTSQYAERTGTDLRRQLVEQWFRLGPRFAKTEGTGHLVTLAREGIAQYKTYLELIIPRMLGMGFIPIVLLLYVFKLDVMSGVILMLTLPILITFLILVGLAAQRKIDGQFRSYKALANHFVDTLRGLETLKTLGQSERHAQTITQVSQRYRKATMSTLRMAFLSSFALDFFTMLSVASVAVGLGLRLTEGHMLLGPALTVLILAPEYFLPVRMVGADYHATLDGKEAGEAIHRMIERGKQAEREQKQAYDQVILHTERENKSSATMKFHLADSQRSADRQKQSTQEAEPPTYDGLWSKTSRLALTDLQVRHEEGAPPSLTDVTFQVSGTSKVGIIGASGAGKSTLIDVLAGFQLPTSGRMVVDGRPISPDMVKSWRSQTALIPQHPYIFSGSLADNIRLYRPEASNVELAAAISAAGLSSLVSSLPHGMDEMIGSGGRQLSGGQEQRVALARALLGARPMLLLDEPTAHLDVETEYELKQTMLPLFEDKLVFLATHRLHWMPHMDWIIVMEAGTVAETGTHAQLMARQGVYYQMIQAQMEAV